MRRLGQILDRDPMALYRYAHNRAALLDGVAELVITEFEAMPASLDWQEQLRWTAHQVRRLAFKHPHVVPLLVTQSLSTPLGLRPAETLRPLETILALLSDAGFSAPDALHISARISVTSTATSLMNCRHLLLILPNPRPCSGWVCTVSHPGNSRTCGPRPRSLRNTTVPQN
ncbi:MAG: transcriptional regulator, TetR family [Micrococcaceae bacterium]|nr:transcriptional regulator, TetR family [Micrococcaceae bacterium]